ncbi:MAG: sulfatase [Sphingobacteriales bacterium]|nr:sulfatase [Sphingobacteriales bacterium]
MLFSGQELNRQEPIFWERAGNRAVRKGDWKLVSIYPQYRWELYNLATDRGETKDLAQQNTPIVNELSSAYFEWAKKNGVVNYETIKPKGRPELSSKPQ